MKNVVHLCDCMDFMRDLPDKYYDLAIVDPPYGINAANMTMGKGSSFETGRLKKMDWDKKIPDILYFNELRRIAKNQIIWGGNYYNIGSSKCYLIWDKKDYNSDFAAAELAWTSFDSVVKIFQHPRNTKEIRIHPTQKPIALYKWLLSKYAKPGQTIFDSHVGSGSIRIACHDLGFDFEGCELDADYWQAQEERYKNHIAQPEIFETKEIYEQGVIE